MTTFKQYCVQEGRLGSMLGAGALAASSLHGDFVKDWSKHYQTSQDPKKELRARGVIDKKYQVPAHAERAIQVAASIFAGDSSFGALSNEIILIIILFTECTGRHRSSAFSYPHLSSPGG